jgi:hypothetical protein
MAGAPPRAGARTRVEAQTRGETRPRAEAPARAEAPSEVGPQPRAEAAFRPAVALGQGALRMAAETKPREER